MSGVGSTAVSGIDELARRFWELLLHEEPTWRHQLGDYTDVARYEDPSQDAQDRLVVALRAAAAEAEAIDPASLDDQQRLTRLVLIDYATSSADLLAAGLADLVGDPIRGVQVSLRLITPMLGVPDQATADAMPQKYRGIGEHLHGLCERARAGVARGWVAPRFAVEGAIAQIDELLATPLEQDPHLRTGEPGAGVDADRLREELTTVVRDHIRPGLQALRDTLSADVLPHARPDDRVGLCHLEGGDAAYRATLRYFTTTTLTAQEIHELGLRQVASLAQEYRELGPEVLGTGDLAEILEAMRSDPEMHFTTGDELVERSREALAKAESVAPQWFSTLNKAPCVVQPTKVGPKAFYYPPASDGSRGGTFFINVDDPQSWGRFELEAMAYHEGVPGHHLQLAIASELPDSIPDFRKHILNSAYAEGWGLYTERLSDEMGLYSEPIDRMGMLSADSMRACRLVVDTGLHAMGWTRQQAVDYMLANSPLTEGVVRPEIDRYIVMPGQATSYMVGRIEIMRMRAEAQERLGDDFDIKAFHAAVLESGGLPLAVLDAHVRQTLAAPDTRA